MGDLLFPVYCCGDDEHDPDVEDFSMMGMLKIEWLAYSYSRGDYDGSGIAYAKIRDRIYTKNIGHCSCYGPWSTGKGWSSDPMSIHDWDGPFDIEQTIATIIEDQATALSSIPGKLAMKVLELLEGAS